MKKTNCGLAGSWLFAVGNAYYAFRAYYAFPTRPAKPQFALPLIKNPTTFRKEP